MRIIEIKASEAILTIHKAQVLTYLRLVVNFGQKRFMGGVE